MRNFIKTKKFSRPTQAGISVLEILVVLAIIGILVAVVIPQFAKIRENQVLKSAVADTVSSLTKARSQTLASLNSSTYGVHFEPSAIVLYKGSAYSSGDANNETINIVSPASITNVTLNGASGTSGELYFARLTGAPSKTGTVTISTTSYSKTITISATGSANSN